MSLPVLLIPFLTGHGAELNEVPSLFNIGRQAIVLGRDPFLRPFVEFDAGLKQAPRLLPKSIWPMASRRFADDYYYKIGLQYNFLSPYSYRGEIISDTVTMNTGNFTLDYYDIPVDDHGIMLLDLGFDLTYMHIHSREEKEKNAHNTKPSWLFGLISTGEDKYIVEEDSLSYGSQFQGRMSVGTVFYKAFGFKSNLYYDVTKWQNPDRRYIDSRGDLAFYDEASEESNRRIALFDKFELYDLGFFIELLHGEEIWNTADAQYIAFTERLNIDLINTYFEFSYKAFNAWAARYIEPKIGFILDESGGEIVALEAGTRLTPREGRATAYRGSLLMSDGILQYRYEMTYLLEDTTGREVNRTGHGVGLGYGGLDGVFELAYYYNYMNHVDLVPGLTDVHFFKAYFSFVVGGPE